MKFGRRTFIHLWVFACLNFVYTAPAPPVDPLKKLEALQYKEGVTEDEVFSTTVEAYGCCSRSCDAFTNPILSPYQIKEGLEKRKVHLPDCRNKEEEVEGEDGVKKMVKRQNKECLIPEIKEEDEVFYEALRRGWGACKMQRCQCAEVIDGTVLLRLIPGAPSIGDSALVGGRNPENFFMEDQQWPNIVAGFHQPQRDLFPPEVVVNNPVVEEILYVSEAGLTGNPDEMTEEELKEQIRLAQQQVTLVADKLYADLGMEPRGGSVPNRGWTLEQTVQDLSTAIYNWADALEDLRDSNNAVPGARLAINAFTDVPRPWLAARPENNFEASRYQEHFDKAMIDHLYSRNYLRPVAILNLEGDETKGYSVAGAKHETEPVSKEVADRNRLTNLLELLIQIIPEESRQPGTKLHTLLNPDVQNPLVVPNVLPYAEYVEKNHTYGDNRLTTPDPRWNLENEYILKPEPFIYGAGEAGFSPFAPEELPIKAEQKGYLTVIQHPGTETRLAMPALPTVAKVAILPIAGVERDPDQGEYPTAGNEDTFNKMYLPHEVEAMGIAHRDNERNVAVKEIQKAAEEERWEESRPLKAGAAPEYMSIFDAQFQTVPIGEIALPAETKVNPYVQLNSEVAKMSADVRMASEWTWNTHWLTTTGGYEIPWATGVPSKAVPNPVAAVPTDASQADSASGKKIIKKVTKKKATQKKVVEESEPPAPTPASAFNGADSAPKAEPTAHKAMKRDVNEQDFRKVADSEVEESDGNHLNNLQKRVEQFFEPRPMPGGGTQPINAPDGVIRAALAPARETVFVPPPIIAPVQAFRLPDLAPDATVHGQGTYRIVKVDGEYVSIYPQYIVGQSQLDVYNGMSPMFLSNDLSTYQFLPELDKFGDMPRNEGDGESYEQYRLLDGTYTGFVDRSADQDWIPRSFAGAHGSYWLQYKAFQDPALGGQPVVNNLYFIPSYTDGRDTAYPNGVWTSKAKAKEEYILNQPEQLLNPMEFDAEILRANAMSRLGVKKDSPTTIYLPVTTTVVVDGPTGKATITGQPLQIKEEIVRLPIVDFDSDTESEDDVPVYAVSFEAKGTPRGDMPKIPDTAAAPVSPKVEKRDLGEEKVLNKRDPGFGPPETWHSKEAQIREDPSFQPPPPPRPVAPLNWVGETKHEGEWNKKTGQFNPSRENFADRFMGGYDGDQDRHPFEWIISGKPEGGDPFDPHNPNPAGDQAGAELLSAYFDDISDEREDHYEQPLDMLAQANGATAGENSFFLGDWANGMPGIHPTVLGDASGHSTGVEGMYNVPGGGDPVYIGDRRPIGWDRRVHLGNGIVGYAQGPPGTLGKIGRKRDALNPAARLWWRSGVVAPPGQADTRILTSAAEKAEFDRKNALRTEAQRRNDQRVFLGEFIPEGYNHRIPVGAAVFGYAYGNKDEFDPSAPPARHEDSPWSVEWKDMAIPIDDIDPTVRGGLSIWEAARLGKGHYKLLPGGQLPGFERIPVVPNQDYFLREDQMALRHPIEVIQGQIVPQQIPRVKAPLALGRFPEEDDGGIKAPFVSDEAAIALGYGRAVELKNQKLKEDQERREQIAKIWAEQAKAQEEQKKEEQAPVAQA